MATASSSQTASRVSSRNRPMRALPLSSLTPVISQGEGSRGQMGNNVNQDSHMTTHGHTRHIEGAGSGWNKYETHPPSPPVRQRANHSAVSQQSANHYTSSEAALNSKPWLSSSKTGEYTLSQYSQFCLSWIHWDLRNSFELEKIQFMWDQNNTKKRTWIDLWLWRLFNLSESDLGRVDCTFI